MFNMDNKKHGDYEESLVKIGIKIGSYITEINQLDTNMRDETDIYKARFIYGHAASINGSLELLKELYPSSEIIVEYNKKVTRVASEIQERFHRMINDMVKAASTSSKPES